MPHNSKNLTHNLEKKKSNEDFVNFGSLCDTWNKITQSEPIIVFSVNSNTNVIMQHKPLTKERVV
jgi:hypothetical protein